ncbi:uncharacterized protein LOC142982814 [Anticarsia gemmatalis]|uniref:uncharacterized protein LOC142982814 n=1 Tax=Anticarsia gemmatalis TaxID=129554 RepID=UPI003F75D8AA
MTFNGKNYSSIYIGHLLDFFYFSIGYALNTLCNITWRHNNVSLVLKIQNIHRILKIDRIVFKKVIIMNWINVISLVLFYVSWILYFHFRIAYYAIYTFFYTLQNVTVLIEMSDAAAGAEMKAMLAYLTTISFSWLVKNIAIHIGTSMETETLYFTMKDVQSVCLQLASREGVGVAQKRTCKNILRIHKTIFRKMRACGMFDVDACMTLELSSLITTYTIVLLQFALSK